MAKLFFPHPAAGFRATNLFKPFNLLGMDLTSRRQFMMLLVSMLGIFLILLTALRQSRYGRRWLALNDSEAASATVGISVATTKVVVYAVSAAMAGIGGALYATANGSVDPNGMFILEKSIPIVLLMAIGGMAYPVAAFFTTFPLMFLALGKRLEQAGAPGWLLGVVTFVQLFGPGLGAVGMVVNQRGAAFEAGRQNARFIPWRSDAKEEHAAARAKAREPEIGELGLTRPFTADELVAIERRLGIADELAASRHPRPRRGAGVAAAGS